MADTQYETYQHYGTDAERLAFTPDPPAATGVQPVYIWYATDTGLTWLYDTSWHQISGVTGGIPATVQGDLLYASAANTLSALAKNASATRYLSNTGGSNNPAWAQVNLTNGVTGVLPVANLESLPMLTADPASPADRTFWGLATGTTPTRTLAIRCRDGGVTYTIASITI